MVVVMVVERRNDGSSARASEQEDLLWCIRCGYMISCAGELKGANEKYYNIPDCAIYIGILH